MKGEGERRKEGGKRGRGGTGRTTDEEGLANKAGRKDGEKKRKEKKTGRRRDERKNRKEEGRMEKGRGKK